MAKIKYQVTPEMIEEIKKLSFNGATQDEMMNYFGWKKDTWYNRQKEHPEFAEAVKQQKAKADVFVRGQLMKLCANLNPAAIFFYHKVHLGATETHKIISQEVEIPNIKGLDPIESAKVVQEFMRNN